MFPKKGSSFTFFFLSLFVAQAYLELVMQLKLALDYCSSCLCLPSARTSGKHYHSKLAFLISENAGHWVQGRTGTSLVMGVAHTGPGPGHGVIARRL